MTILVYKDGRWLIDNKQPLEGVSLDNLAAILSNPKDGDVVKYDEESGMWIAGEAGGGGGSGGGVLVVHDVDGTMDKTWQEIHDALLTGGAIVLRADGQDAYCDIVFSAIKAIDESSFDVVCGSLMPPGNAGAWPYSASSASGYPAYSE